MDEAEAGLAEIHWEGDSLDAMRSFPKPIRSGLGAELYPLQFRRFRARKATANGGKGTITRGQAMSKTRATTTHVSTGNVFEDLNFSPEEAAVMALKVQLHAEIMTVVKREKPTPRTLERRLDVPQPRVSELLSGKVAKMSSDKLAKYLYQLGRSVQVKTRKLDAGIHPA